MSLKIILNEHTVSVTSCLFKATFEGLDNMCGVFAHHREVRDRCVVPCYITSTLFSLQQDLLQNSQVSIGMSMLQVQSPAEISLQSLSLLFLYHVLIIKMASMSPSA